MRLSFTLCAGIAVSGFVAMAQTMPKSNYFCSVSASGMMMCSGLSTPPITFNGVRAKTDPKGVFVTRYALEPGTELPRTREVQDVLIVAMNDGELVNKAKSPQSHLTVSNGFVMLMPKEEDYRFRNAGAQTLELLVIDVRK